MPAGLGRRLVAYLVDRLCVGLVAAGAAVYVLLPVLEQDPGSAAFEAALEEAAPAAVAVWGLLHAAYFCCFGVSGATPGKVLLGLAVVGPDGGAPGAMRALVRELAGRWLCVLSLGVGYLWALRGGRGWHDLLAGTRVFCVPARSLAKGGD